MSEQKEQNQKTREMMIFYTPVYNLIIQSRLLSLTERTLASLIASYQGMGCNWSREALKEYCECGPYHLDRAIKRLQFMHIIRVQPGPPRRDGSKRREKNRYTFEADPYHWRVTKEMQEQIVSETLAMKKESKSFYYDAFPNEIGLEISFAKTFPKYANGKKGRRKKDSFGVGQDLAMIDDVGSSIENKTKVESESEKWSRKYQNISDENVRFTYLAGEYYLHLKAMVRASEDPFHKFSEHKLNFLERLKYIYADKCKLLKPNELEVHNQIAKWLADGLSSMDIYLKLSSLDLETRISQEG